MELSVSCRTYALIICRAWVSRAGTGTGDGALEIAHAAQRCRCRINLVPPRMVSRTRFISALMGCVGSVQVYSTRCMVHWGKNGAVMEISLTVRAGLVT